MAEYITKEEAVQELYKVSHRLSDPPIDTTENEIIKVLHSLMHKIEQIPAADAVAKAKEEWQTEQQKQQSELEAAVADAQSRAAAMEKQLAIKGDDKTVRFSILFEQVQADLINCINLVNEISAEDAEKADKYRNALRKACDMALGGTD